jgi:hypothetical protein
LGYDEVFAWHEGITLLQILNRATLIVAFAVLGCIAVIMSIVAIVAGSFFVYASVADPQIRWPFLGTTVVVASIMRIVIPSCLRDQETGVRESQKHRYPRTEVIKEFIQEIGLYERKFVVRVERVRDLDTGKIGHHFHLTQEASDYMDEYERQLDAKCQSPSDASL